MDAGSTWNGKRDYGFELIRIARECGADAIKFQLFKGEEYTKAGNLELSYDLFREFHLYGKSQKIPVSASAFSGNAVEYLVGFDIPFIKFGYSVRRTLADRIKGCVNMGKRVFMSTDVMDSHLTPNHPSLKKFYVHTDRTGAIYPVTEVITFEDFFPERFQGFSDHSLGTENAIRALDAGCTHFECHMTLPYSDIEVPDRWFAKEPEQLEAYIRRLKQ